MKNNWGKPQPNTGKSLSTARTPPQLSPDNRAFFVKGGTQPAKGDGRTSKQGDNPFYHPPSLASPSFLIGEGNPKHKGPLFSTPSPRLRPLNFTPQTPDLGTCKPPPLFTPPRQACFPGTESPKFFSSAALPKGPSPGEPGTWRSGRLPVPRSCGPSRPGWRFPRCRPPSLPACLPASLPVPTRPWRPPSTYPEGVGAIGAAEAPERHTAGSGTGEHRQAWGGGAAGGQARLLAAAAVAVRAGGSEEGAGAATPSDWPASHGDAAEPPRPGARLPQQILGLRPARRWDPCSPAGATGLATALGVRLIPHPQRPVPPP